MKWLLIVLLSLVPGLAFAQAPMVPGAQPTPSVADLDQQLQEVGCKAERNAAAQTIVQLRTQIDDLQKQIKRMDPPKSGATKH